jgi:hypothetical protein
MRYLTHKNINALIYPPSCYLDGSRSENVIFNTELQGFAQEISYISGLEASGQISPKNAYKEVKLRWKELKKFKKKLKISKNIGNLVAYQNVKKVF